MSLALLVTGCAPEGAEAPSPAPSGTVTAGAEGDPSVTFVTPVNNGKFALGTGGATIAATTVVVDGTPDLEVLYLLDGVEVGQVAQGVAFNFTGVPAGRRQLVAQLVDAGGVELINPESRSVVHVRVIDSCGAAGDCDDGLACSNEACVAGACNFGPVAGCCDNDYDCSVGSTCVDNACVECLADGDCDDGDLCTDDSCGLDGQCVNAVVAGCCESDAQCDDDDVCTSDACDVSTNTCSNVDTGVAGCCNTAADCIPSDPCQTTMCYSNKKLGVQQCRFGPISAGCCTTDAQCDDGKACTADTCVLGSGGAGTCDFAELSDCCTSAADCDDNDPSTVDSCAANVCTNEPDPLFCKLPDTQVVINEVFWAVGDTGAGTWFELHNLGDTLHNLNGYVITHLQHGESHVISPTNALGGTSGLFLPPGGYFVLGSSKEKFTNGFIPNYHYGSDIVIDDPAEAGAALQTLIVRSPDGTVLTELTIDGGKFCVGAKNASCELINPHDDLTDGVRWQTAGMNPNTKLNQVYIVGEGVHGSPRAHNRSSFRNLVDANCIGLVNTASCEVAACSLEGQCVADRDPNCCNGDEDCEDFDACTVNTCNLASRTCNEATLVDGCCQTNADCDDGNPCNLDRCIGNNCRHSPNVIEGCCLDDSDCDDGLACTLDLCNEETQECEAPIPVELPDGLTCCEDADGCDDGDPSTLDTCNLIENVCEFPTDPFYCDAETPCDDGDVCTTGVCDLGSSTCTFEEVADCCSVNADCADDGNVCTFNVCNTATGECAYPDKPGCCLSGTDCDDGNPCTEDTCSAANICRSFTTAGCCSTDEECDDFDGCTIDACDTVSNTCGFQKIEGCCTPGSSGAQLNSQCGPDPDGVGACYAWTCPNGLCVEVVNEDCCSENTDCDDGNPCTLDFCQAGVCKSLQNEALEGCCAADADCSTGEYCSVGGLCVTLKLDGQLCVADGECFTGNCVDGVCCNSECDSGCERCDMPGMLGQCQFTCDGSCCEAKGTPGCEDEAVTTCVCDVDPTCCEGIWDLGCVAAVDNLGCNVTLDESCQEAACGDSVCSGNETCVSCAEDCGACVGSCCADNGTPGCDDTAVQDCVCAVAPFCCTTTWDDTCADVASLPDLACGADCPTCGDGVCAGDEVENCLTCAEDCGACAGVCGDGACDPTESCVTCPSECGDCEGDCCVGNGSVGCDDLAVQDCMCASDPFCCNNVWDESCAAKVNDLGCGVCPTCGDGFCDGDYGENCTTCSDDCGACVGDCCADNDSPACLDKDTYLCVCSALPECCSGTWTQMCVDAVESLGCGTCSCGDGECADGIEDCGVCPADCGSCEGDCCTADSGSIGCDDDAVTACVCDAYPHCCDTEWDQDCVDAVNEQSCGACAVCGDSVCSDALGEDCTTCAADCGSCEGGCCDGANGTIGCIDDDITACVCGSLPECCDVAWDDACVTAVENFGCGTCSCGDGTCSAFEDCVNCQADCGACTGDCCTANNTVGCDDPAVTSCVCAQDSSCCETAWSATCTELAFDCGDTECPGCGNATCEPNENCDTCSADCGACPAPVCGDGTCSQPTIGNVVVDVADFSFTPDALVITEGDAVVFTNVGTIPHSVTASNGNFDSGLFSPPNQYVFTATNPGVFEVVSTTDPTETMVLSLTVLPADAVSENCIDCEADCGACVGGCCASNNTLGCSDADCQDLVCGQDSFCCEGIWDPVCANIANDLCPTLCNPPPDECVGATGSCLLADSAAGCDDEQCCANVCAVDPFCCQIAWLGSCANTALEVCGDYAAGDCCLAEGNGTVGCDDGDCVDLVCEQDSFCCTGAWDDGCATLANEVCVVCGAKGDCCDPDGHATAGCTDFECENIVCGDDAFCCDTAWDPACTEEAFLKCDICDKGSCCEEKTTAGCNEAFCEDAVCAIDEACCSDVWDEACVAISVLECTVCAADVCGDDLCDAAETCVTCPADCGECSVCGDGVCEDDEGCDFCSIDCGACPGDGDCCSANNTPGCEVATCQNAVCEQSSACCEVAWGDSCAALSADLCELCDDGEPECGDDICEGNETCSNCYEDCGFCPGTGDCCTGNGSAGCISQQCQTEVCVDDEYCCLNEWDTLCAIFAATDCPALCEGVDPGPLCDDGVCEDDEDCALCPQDCGECEVCGDGVCDPETEDCAVCEDDCGACEVCGDEICQDTEDCSTCTEDCGFCPGVGDCCLDNGSPGCDTDSCQTAVCAIEPFCCDIDWDATCVDFARGACTGLCESVICGDGTCTTQEFEETYYLDVYDEGVVVVDGTPDGTSNNQLVTVGDTVRWCNLSTQTQELNFVVTPVGVEAFVSEAFAAGDCLELTFDKDGVYQYASNANSTVNGSVIVELLSAFEDCVGCPGDCGACLGDCCNSNGTLGCDDSPCQSAVCADDPTCCTVSWGVDCALLAATACPSLCVGGPNCGDEICSGIETCDNCEADCGPCPFCGDGTCNIGETCADCSADCGFCPGTEDCCSAHDTPGCSDPTCQQTICDVEPTCCTQSWTDDCADGAAGAACIDLCAGTTCGDGACEAPEDCFLCPEDCGVCTSDGDCCETGLEPSCNNAECAAAVCAVMPFCCELAWDFNCANQAETLCPALCSDSTAICGDGICEVYEPVVRLVWMEASGFVPADRNIAQGDTVRWVNNDPLLPHSTVSTAVVEPMLPWDSGPLSYYEESGNSSDQDFFERTFEVLGLFEYTDGFNADATGSITVFSATDNETCDTCPEDCGECQLNDCCAANGSPGCLVPECNDAVCATYPGCCDTDWTQECADYALTVCTACGASPSNCCYGWGGTGCADTTCSAAVCAVNSGCCDTEWNASCSDIAKTECSTLCP